jgi:hypothetical protein
MATVALTFFGPLVWAMEYAAPGDLSWLLPMLPVMGASSLYFFALRCPHCGGPVYRRTLRVGGIRVPYWGSGRLLSPFPKTCGECQQELGW